MTRNSGFENKEMETIYSEIKEKGKFYDYKIEFFAPHDKAADKIAKYLGDKMKTNQLRKVFSEIKRIEISTRGKGESDKFENPELLMLLPQIAYAKARKLIKKDFYEIIKLIIGKGINDTKIKTNGDFTRFVEFMTAIVAYHKQYAK